MTVSVTSGSPTSSLEQARRYAAELSGGTSGELIYDAILRAVREFRLGGEVLDFGAGTGTLTRRLESSGLFSTVSAADLMARPEGSNFHWIRADLNHPLPIPDAAFDSILAAEVIEHLENPRAMMRELFRLLRPGGRVVISTPNNESWRSLISLTLRGHYVAFCNGSYPAHITALVRKDLERSLLEAGFESLAFRFTTEGGIPGLPTISWQQISGGILNGVRFSDNVVAIAAKPTGTK